jgi:uncharacterized protein YndB with AHSA1/START domain
VTVPHDSVVGNLEVAERSGVEREVHEQTIEAPPRDVWGFMVDPAALSVWFGADAWLDPRVGGVVLFRFGDGSVRRGIVEEVDSTRRLTWRWREHQGAGFALRLGEPSRVTIELQPKDTDATATLVRITETPVPASPRASSAAPR